MTRIWLTLAQRLPRQRATGRRHKAAAGESGRLNQADRLGLFGPCARPETEPALSSRTCVPGVSLARLVSAYGHGLGTREFLVHMRLTSALASCGGFAAKSLLRR